MDDGSLLRVLNAVLWAGAPHEKKNSFTVNADCDGVFLAYFNGIY